MSEATVERDDTREQRIAQFIAGSADEYERISAWYGYLEEHIHFPFQARLVAAPTYSAGRLPELVEVIDLACVDDCEEQIYVSLGGKKYGRDVPLALVQPSDPTDERTRQAVGDWHYWVKRGYHFWIETEQ